MKAKQLAITAASLLAAASVFAAGDLADTAVNTGSFITGVENAADGGAGFNEDSRAYSAFADEEWIKLLNNLRTNGYYYDEIKEILVKYNDLVLSYSLPQTERAQIIGKSASESDFGFYLDVCAFLKMTDTGLSAADEIYRLADKNSSDAIESAYAAYTEKAGEELTVADVQHYVDGGVTPEEIAAAYELTLKGCKNVREVLDDYLSGESWSNIISQAYFLNENVFGSNATLADIASIKNIADKTGCGMNAVIEINENERPSVTSNAAELYTGKQILIDSSEAKIGGFENLDLMISEEASEKLPGISHDNIRLLMKQGYKIRDIENAAASNALTETENGVVISESGAILK